MTTLVVDELISSFEQPIYIQRSIKALSIKFHFYVHNMPVGNFKFEIWKDGELFAEFPFTSLDLRNSFGGSSQYFRVFYPFGVGSNISLKEGSYVFKITSIGYVYSASSFLALCKDWQGYFGGISDENAEFTEYPYSFRIIERKSREF